MIARTIVAFDHLRDALSVIFGLSVTQVTGAGPSFSEYVHDSPELEDPLPMTSEPEHPEDLVPAEDEAPIEAYITESNHGSDESCSTIHLSSTTSIRDTTIVTYTTPDIHLGRVIFRGRPPPWKRLLLTALRPVCEVGESSAAVRQPGPTMACRVDCSSVDTVDVRSRESSEFYSRHHDAQKDRAAVRAEIEVLRRERLAYEQESMENRQALARSEAYSRALEARITVLETQARRHEWQRQDAEDHATRHIMRIQALEAGARDDTLEDTASRRYRSFVLISYPKWHQNAATRSTRSQHPAPTATPQSGHNGPIQAMINQGVTAALAARDANRNGDDSHTSGTGGRRAEHVVRECTYQDFMKCKPLYFKGTEGVVELTQWLKDGGCFPHRQLALGDLRKKMTDKYCPRNEMKLKLEAELWNLKVKGTDFVIRLRTKEVCKTLPKTIQNQNKDKRQNTGRAYTAGTSEKKPYGRSKPLCAKCNYHHDGPCAPKCHKCNKVGHFARDCRSAGNANNAIRSEGHGSGHKYTCFEVEFKTLQEGMVQVEEQQKTVESIW
ncbi:putative reverse transcriptase domain-containing protein [Tanacetum coccineum]